MLRTCPIPISSSAPAASSGSRISCCGRPPTANSSFCRSIGRISTAPRSSRRSRNIGDANAGSVASSHGPGPEPWCEPRTEAADPGLGGEAGAAVLFGLSSPGAALAVLALGAIVAAGLAGSERGVWILAGGVYAGAMLAAPAVLRSDAQLGRSAVFLIFGVVWTTDVMAYFVG